MSRSADTTARVYLALSNVDIIGIAVAKAKVAGAVVTDIAVILTDTRDVLARELTSAIIQRSSDLDLDAEEARVLKRELIPTGLAIVPCRAAEMLFKETHPSVAEGTRVRPPAGTVRVVVVAAGGATLLHLPIGPVPPGGSA